MSEFFDEKEFDNDSKPEMEKSSDLENDYSDDEYLEEYLEEEYLEEDDLDEEYSYLEGESSYMEFLEDKEFFEEVEEELKEIFESELEAEKAEIKAELKAEAQDPSETYESLVSEKFEQLEALLDNKKYSEFRNEIEELNPVDIADFFSDLPLKRIPAVFKLLRKDISAEVFAELESDMQKKIIDTLTDREISQIVEELYIDDAADMLDELPANIVHRVMRNTSPETRAQINKLLAYPDNCAGSIMTAEFISIRASITCASAIEYIRQTGVDKETVYYAYVIDGERKLLGTVSFKQLLFADPYDSIRDIMEEQIIFAHTLDDRESVAQTISKYDLLALPIVDKENRLVGIVTVDDALDVIEEEATQDIEMMAAITPTDKPYIKTGVFETWGKRIPWLVILMISGIFTSMIIQHYEEGLGKYAILTAFIPMLMSTGGNAGSQSSVAIIRALSLDEISMKDFFRVLWKEMRVSVLCGICLGIVCFIKTIGVDFLFDCSGKNIMIAFIVSVTACLTVVVAKIIGTMLPIAAKRIKLDPAVMASPFITTIVDSITLVIYFAIASKALGL